MTIQQQQAVDAADKYASGLWPRESLEYSKSWEDYRAGHLAGAASQTTGGAGVYQQNVGKWMLECFGEGISKDVPERNYRFLEEALELVQALNCSKADCLRLVEYVFNRPAGEAKQEIGGVMVTLAALCNAAGENMEDAGNTEIARCWQKIDKIRQKHFSKPVNVRSPLPGYAESPSVSLPENIEKENTIRAYGLTTRVWTEHEKYGYGCSECCNGDRCDEDCTAVYKRKDCPHCKGRGWIPKSDVEEKDKRIS